MIRAILICILFVLGIAFIFQNEEIFLHEFRVHYKAILMIFDDQPVSNSLLLVASFLFGVIVCLVSIGLSSISKSMKINELQKKINILEKTTSSKEDK